MILITGGAGFIGANFVLDWLGGSREGVVNLDKLTYAGNLENLASLKGNASHIFAHGDIGDSALVAKLLAHTSPGPSSTLPPRAMSTARSTAQATSSRPTSSAPSTCSKPCAPTGPACPKTTKPPSASCMSPPTRSMAHSAKDDPAFTETTTYEPNSPYSASKAASDHLVRAYHHTYGLPVLTTNCSNNYGPYHFPEKLIPLMIVNALAGKPCRCTATASRSATGCMSKTTAAPSAACSKRAAWAKPTTSAAGTKKPTSTSCTPLRHARRAAPPQADGKPYKDQITYVTDRPGHDRRYAIDVRKLERELGWKPAETFETGIRKTVQWYLDNPDWVAHVQSGAYRDWVQKQYA